MSSPFDTFTESITLITDVNQHFRKRINQLERILEDVLVDGVQDCNGTCRDGVPCVCSTARARRVLDFQPEFPEVTA